MKPTYEPSAGTPINRAVVEALVLARQADAIIGLQFNGRNIEIDPAKSEPENILAARRAMQLPDVDPPFHPVTAADALKRWDNGEHVFTVEMGGLGPGYEQAIQILVFEIIRDELGKPLPTEEKSPAWSTWGDAAVSRINSKMGGYSGAQVGAAKNVAYRALRDGWGEMLKTAPQDRLIQVSKSFPTL